MELVDACWLWLLCVDYNTPVSHNALLIPRAFVHEVPLPLPLPRPAPPGVQGLKLVHFSAQLKRVVWDRAAFSNGLGGV